MKEEMIRVTDPKTGEKVEFPKKEVKVIPPVEGTEEKQTMATARERGEDVTPLTRAKHGLDVHIKPKNTNW